MFAEQTTLSTELCYLTFKQHWVQVAKTLKGMEPVGSFADQQLTWNKENTVTYLSAQPSSFRHSLLSNLLRPLGFFTHLFLAKLSKLQQQVKAKSSINYYGKLKPCWGKMLSFNLFVCYSFPAYLLVQENNYGHVTWHNFLCIAIPSFGTWNTTEYYTTSCSGSRTILYCSLRDKMSQCHLALISRWQVASVALLVS